MSRPKEPPETLEADRRPEKQVAAHYGRGGLAERIFAVLRDEGRDLTALTQADVAPYDEMHVRGRAASDSLRDRAGFTAAMHVLDVGSGAGGPSRFLAESVGCRITGIDLTPDLCRAAAALTEAVGLSDRVRFQVASALDLPFEDAAFDGAWSQHVQMNIADKARLYGEIARVLKSGARFAAYDILAGPAGAPYYPCPWAPVPEISFLIDPETWRAAVEGAGFVTRHWRDRSAEGLAWFEGMASANAADPDAAARRVRVVGTEAVERIQNLRRSLEDERAVLIEAVFRKP